METQASSPETGGTSDMSPQASQVAQESQAAQPAQTPQGRRRWWIVGYRRNLLVNPRSQLKAIVFPTLAVAIVLTALLTSMYVARQREIGAIAPHMPELATTLQEQTRVNLAYQVTGSAIFLTMVFVVLLLDTHRTAGAAVNLKRNLARVRDGERGVRIRLRRGDNLQDVADAINEMSIALDERVWGEIEILEDLAAQAERLAEAADARQLADALHEQVAVRREAVGFPETAPAD